MQVNSYREDYPEASYDQRLAIMAQDAILLLNYRYAGAEYREEFDDMKLVEIPFNNTSV